MVVVLLVRQTNTGFRGTHKQELFVRSVPYFTIETVAMTCSSAAFSVEVCLVSAAESAQRTSQDFIW